MAVAGLSVMVTKTRWAVATLQMGDQGDRAQDLLWEQQVEARPCVAAAVPATQARSLVARPLSARAARAAKVAKARTAMMKRTTRRLASKLA